jgi:hypothetical protein
VLTSPDKSHKLEGIIEVETGESVNHLEAMAQWAHFGRARAPFHLYVPAAAVDIARRLCVENQVSVSEIWSYHSIGDQTRFTLVQRSAQVKPPPERVAPKVPDVKPAPKAVVKTPAAAPKKPAAPKKNAAPKKKVAQARTSAKTSRRK